MSQRARQRDATRASIIDAAVISFAERGFHGASTRQIANRAKVNQGLITYHFGTKDALWQAAMHRSFAELSALLLDVESRHAGEPKRMQARAIIREFVRFAAANPSHFRLMLDQGRVDDERLRWMVETHLSPGFSHFRELGEMVGFAGDDTMAAHFFYVLAGAGSLIFALSPECKQLTGMDPRKKAAVERHADLVARLLVP